MSKQQNHVQPSNPLLFTSPRPDLALPEKPFQVKHKRGLRCCTICIGFILVLFSLQTAFVPHLLKQILDYELSSAFIFYYPHSLTNKNYQRFVGNYFPHSQPLYMIVQFYNVTNYHQLINHHYNGSKFVPALSLTPQITYNQYEMKYDLNFSDNGEFVYFNQKEWYSYNLNLSILTPNEEIIIISPLIATIYEYYYHSHRITSIAFNEILDYLSNKPQLMFLKGNVTHLLFDLHSIDIPLSNGSRIHMEFGILGNNSKQIGYKMNTGYSDNSKYGEILEYENNEYIDCWDPAMQITDESRDFLVQIDYFGLWRLYHAHRHEKISSTKVIAWITQLKRGVPLTYIKKSEHNGVPVYLYYVSTSPMLDNTSINPSNARYFQFGPSGVENLTHCSDDVSIFVSLPLFVNATDYQKNLTKFGISENVIEYANNNPPFLKIEPITGSMFECNKSLQLNTQMKSLQYEKIVKQDKNKNTNTRATSNNNNHRQLSSNTSNYWFENIEEMMVPCIVLSNYEYVDHEASNQLRLAHFVIELIDVLTIVGYVATTLLVLYSSTICFCLGYKKEKQQMNDLGKIQK